MATPRYVYDVLDSTQDRIVELARNGASTGTRVVARTQTAGRGRLDHRWASPRGGLYLSVLLPDPPEPTAFVSLAAAAALKGMLEESCGVRSAIRWPNDLVVPGMPARKLAGLLLERLSVRGRTVVALGVGLNVAAVPSEFPPDLAPQVVSLSELVAFPPSLDELEERLVDGLEAMAAELPRPDGREHWLEEYRRGLYGRGRAATLDGVPVGRIREIGPEGELWVDGDTGPVSLRAGELRIEGTA
jgi:BirA family biotin operon repressor/biotin-[acetyl-CoA-carboxylase] ligase